MEKRLLKILEYYNFSPSAFADKLNVQRSSISHLLSGRNKPGFDFISKLITEFPELNIEWFINGSGKMLKSDPEPSTNPTLFDIRSLKSNTEASEKENYLQESNIKFTNVINQNDFENNISENTKTNKKSVFKIILFFDDHSWQEFLPSDS